MSGLKVEKGVPLPPRGGGSSLVATLVAMEVGDSFLHPTAVTRGDIAGTLQNVGARGVKIATRQTREGLRLWRVENK